MSVGIAQVMAQQLVQQGVTVPALITGQALIDTGASITCIDNDTALALGVPAIDIATMHSTSHAGVQANIYPIRFEIAGLSRGIEVPRAMGAALKSQGFILLIGRDILQMCTLFYNGLSGEFTLSL